MNFEWHKSPREFRLSSDVVHVWKVGLNWSQAKLADAYSILPDFDQARADRFVVDKPRQAYIAAHAALNHLLCCYLNISNEELRFKKGEHGKPFLTNDINAINLQFNLSHSHQQALIGVSQGKVLGVDLQLQDPRTHYADIMQRFFAPGEVAEFQALPMEQQQLAFFRLWVRKEAYLKLTGEGLSRPLNAFSVSLAAGNVSNILRVASGQEEQVEFLELVLADAYLGCIALYDKPRQLLGYTFDML